jgi:hypothetical protein
MSGQECTKLKELLGQSGYVVEYSSLKNNLGRHDVIVKPAKPAVPVRPAVQPVPQSPPVQPTRAAPAIKQPAGVLPLEEAYKRVKTLLFSFNHCLRNEFSVFDVLNALKLSNANYLNVWYALDTLRRKGSLERFSYVIHSRRRVFFAIKKRDAPPASEKTSDEKSSDEKKPPHDPLPSDTSVDVLKKIFENFTTFNAEALQRVANKYGSFYGKWSAKALVNWIAKNREYAEELTGKRLSIGGQDDYLFVQVFDGLVEAAK